MRSKIGVGLGLWAPVWEEMHAKVGVLVPAERREGW